MRIYRRKLIYSGCIYLLKKDTKRARQQLQRAHDVLQNHIILHPICHMMMAVTYRKQPIQMTKEIYLGIMAPWASIRRQMH